MGPSSTRTDSHRLADRLVRARTRMRAVRVAREKFPEAARRIDLAYEEGRRLFPVTPEHYAQTVWHVLGRVWRRCLAQHPGTSLEDVLARVDRGSFLRDLAAWSAGVEDPESGATSFYLAFSGFGAKVDDWFHQAEARDGLGEVSAHRFRRKCYGAALYYLLNPLRAAAHGPPRITGGFEWDPTRLLAPLDDQGWFYDLYFAVALGSANTRAIELFPERYGGRIRAFMLRRGVPPDRVDELTEDVRTDCVLSACNYFAAGSFWGWLLFQCMNYLRRWAPSRGSDQFVHSLQSGHVERSNATEAAGVVERAWGRLSEWDRHMLLSYWAERRTLRELAVRLDVHESTAMRHRDRAERQCRLLLREEARQFLGDDASEDECLQFLLENSRHLDFGFGAPEATPEMEESDSESRGDYCPMIPYRLP